ncbi:MAG: hypothetical protein K1X67_17565 [Fimbriimonadaceae bacterium]|nr:hypothetical protein [Fimbriimonadaceae bacterium]
MEHLASDTQFLINLVKLSRDLSILLGAPVGGELDTEAQELIDTFQKRQEREAESEESN